MDETVAAFEVQLRAAIDDFLRTTRPLLERDDVLKMEGMTPERTEVLLAFLAELTEENMEAEAPSEVQAGAEAPSEVQTGAEASSEVQAGAEALSEQSEPTEAPPAA